MSLTDAQKRATNKWDAEHMTVLGCKVRKTDAERYREAAKSQGTTINAVLKQALEDLANKNKGNGN